MADKTKQQQQKQQQHVQQHINKIRKNHPDCIPIYFIKHHQAQKSLKDPSCPMVLFHKDLKIEQAMFNLYNQIKVKGLYFFTPNKVAKNGKFIFLKPGVTIDSIYKKYSNQRILTIVYSDAYLGMGGINKMEKWLTRIAIFLGIIWLMLFIFPYARDFVNNNNSTQQTQTIQNSL